MADAPNSRRDNPRRGSFILAVDDNADDRYLLDFAFKRSALPHTIYSVADGEQAIAYLKGDPPYANRNEFPFPDLVLLDIKMPKATGFDVLMWMRHSAHPMPPVLILSGSELEADRQKALDLGAREFHFKQVQIDNTIKLLQDLSERWLKPAV